MTDMTNVPNGLTIKAEFGENAPAFEIDETYWGYIIKKPEGPASFTMIIQGISMFLGACFAAAALGLLILPQSIAGSADLMMRGGAAVFLGALAAYLLWFSSRGSKSELQIDNSLGEVREVVRNRAGKASLIGRYGFDSIGGVFMDRNAGRNGQTVLMLRYRNTAQTLPVAFGPEKELERLRDRLGQDLMLDTIAAPNEVHEAPLGVVRSAA